MSRLHCENCGGDAGPSSNPKKTVKRAHEQGNRILCCACFQAGNVTKRYNPITGELAVSKNTCR